MRYRSKPQEVESLQWTGDNLDEIEAFGVKFRYSVMWPEHFMFKAGKDGVQGYVEVPAGYWIVRQPGDLSDHWPVDPDYFAKNYIALDVEDGDADDRTTQWRDRAEADRFYKALTRIYQSGKGRHVEIARAALDGEEVDR